jgi:hypothetical protein
VLGLRRRNPWLVDAMIETEQAATRIFIRARARHGEQSLALALNLTGERSRSPTVRLSSKPSLTSQSERCFHTAGQWSQANPKPSGVPR